MRNELTDIFQTGGTANLFYCRALPLGLQLAPTRPHNYQRDSLISLQHRARRAASPWEALNKSSMMVLRA